MAPPDAFPDATAQWPAITAALKALEEASVRTQARLVDGLIHLNLVTDGWLPFPRHAHPAQAWLTNRGITEAQAQPASHNAPLLITVPLPRAPLLLAHLLASVTHRLELNHRLAHVFAPAAPHLLAQIRYRPDRFHIEVTGTGTLGGCAVRLGHLLGATDLTAGLDRRGRAHPHTLATRLSHLLAEVVGGTVTVKATPETADENDCLHLTMSSGQANQLAHRLSTTPPGPPS